MKQIEKKVEIPILPKHSRQAWKAFFIAFGLMLIGIISFGVGVVNNSNPLQIAGGLTGMIGFLGLFVSFNYFQIAQCPKCFDRMSQGWNSQKQRSNGVFTCKHCNESWRTKATWGIE